MGMRRAILVIGLVGSGLGLGGCTAEPPAGQPGYYVPFAAVSRPYQMARGNPAHLLPLEAEADYQIGRQDRGYWGAVQLGGESSYTEYTYDAQPIGTRDGLGYRYHIGSKSAVSVP